MHIFHKWRWHPIQVTSDRIPIQVKECKTCGKQKMKDRRPWL